MENYDLKKRTKEFAYRCVKLATALPQNILGRHLAGQLIRLATSVAANYRAACVAQSKASFVAKLSIAYEESDESYFWIEFIMDEKMIPVQKISPLLKEADNTCSFKKNFFYEKINRLCGCSFYNLHSAIYIKN